MNSSPTLPEVAGSALDGPTLKHAIENSGAIIVREIVSADDARELDAGFVKALNAAQTREEGAWFTPFDDGTAGIKWARAWTGKVGCSLMADSPAMVERVLDVYRRNGVIELLTQYLGETPVLSAHKSTLRRTLGNKIYTDNWHQDGAFLGADTKVMNVWLALTPCGERAASIEIGLQRQHGIVAADGAAASWTVSPQQAAKASPTTTTPICAPGDAILFDHLCLHRTSINPAYSEDRHALETWFFAPSTYPHEFDPSPIKI